MDDTGEQGPLNQLSKTYMSSQRLKEQAQGLLGLLLTYDSY